MLRIYTSPTCIKCKVIKQICDVNGIQYEESDNYSKLMEHGFNSLPVLEIESGDLLDFEEALKYLGEEN